MQLDYARYAALFGWLWLVAGADLVSEKSTAGCLMLNWCERKTLPADTLAE